MLPLMSKRSEVKGFQLHGQAVTGDSDGIDVMTRRVEKLSEPLNSTSFDIFDREYKTSWDAIMTEFSESVATIEAMTSTFINSSFENLRSAEAAFDLLQRFRNIESRDSINKQMMEKFDDILTRLDVELSFISDLFDKHHEHPPRNKDSPPVAAGVLLKSGVVSTKCPCCRELQPAGAANRLS